MSILSSFRDEFIKYLFDNNIQMYASHEDEKRGNWNFTKKKEVVMEIFYINITSIMTIKIKNY